MITIYLQYNKYRGALSEEPVYAHQCWPPMQITILNSWKRVRKKQKNRNILSVINCAVVFVTNWFSDDM